MIDWHDYPYTDLHELNLDWVISKLKELDQRVDDILVDVVRQATEGAIEASKEYIDEQMSDITQQFDEVKSVVNNLSTDVSICQQQIIDLAGDVDDLESDMLNRFDTIYGYVDGQIIASNARTDAVIQANNNIILGTMSTYLSNIKVLNYFTGEYVTIQDMFDYLCMFHLQNSIDYSTMNSRALTYTQFNALNMTYTDLAMNGGTLYV